MNYIEQYINKSPDIVFRKVDTDVLLFPIQQNVGDLCCIYSLNESGAFIWELINGKRKLIEITDLIVEKYRIDKKEAEADILMFFEELQKIDAIKLEFTGKEVSSYIIDVDNRKYEKPKLVSYSFNDKNTTPKINVAWTMNCETRESCGGL
ncbi:PqqD family protein [Methanosarcina sp. Z-7115]|uniref:PqqD family protein n=1 Tax=Methanosarcina baikalica TaxID=3073890 RepID=A0ABU2D4D5_9EURY|nr:PqqD family protein [Methanosarcina sp. Z-7115]MDR7666854.1 PqqD family protein [Methanosarcina sp. Z-7115]